MRSSGSSWLQHTDASRCLAVAHLAAQVPPARLPKARLYGWTAGVDWYRRGVREKLLAMMRAEHRDRHGVGPKGWPRTHLWTPSRSCP
jgi:hypothetical protein